MYKNKKYLIVNPGSASMKYALYENKREIVVANFEKDISSGGVMSSFFGKGIKLERKYNGKDYEKSMDIFVDFLLEKKLIIRKSDINIVGFRIVAPGDYFNKVRSIDARYIKKLKNIHEVAPLHIGSILLEIKKVVKLLPKTIRLGVSDSAFHSTIPEVAKVYGLPSKDAKKFNIHRYGYHGISIESVLRKTKKIFKKPPSRIIICHLGSGVSITAIKDNKSIDTSMGFTPLEGPLMGTRVGDFDAGALLYLAKKLKFSHEKINEYINEECGLLGVSGKTADVRELLMFEKKDYKSSLALDVFVYRIKKYIGAYVATLGKPDLIIFTATIGERSSIIRERICHGLEPLGIILDKKKNKQINEGKYFIQNQKSKIKIAVVGTNEMEEIAIKIQE